MPVDPKKKKKASTTPDGKNETFTVKSDPNKIVSKKRKKIANIRTKAQKITEKDRRMQAAREASTAKEVKKAGGTKTYLEQTKKTKSGLIKYKGRYVRKSSAAGKAAIKKRDKK
jgi:hypothetical protein